MNSTYDSLNYKHAGATASGHSAQTSNDFAPIQDKGKEVLAIIPARGNSKGIPRKNIRLLAGKPLIAYTIETALATRSISRVIVSTDDEAIADVALRYGAEVPFLRPADISGDYALTSAVSDHALQTMAEQGYEPDYQVMLYPTSPLRSVGLLEELVAIGLEQSCNIITARKLVVPEAGLYTIEKDGNLRLATTRLQVKGNGYVTVGASREGATTLQTPCYRSYGFFTGTTLGERAAAGTYIHVLNNPFHILDIDMEQDLALAEKALRMGWFLFD